MSEDFRRALTDGRNSHPVRVDRGDTRTPSLPETVFPRPTRAVSHFTLPRRVARPAWMPLDGHVAVVRP